MKIRRNPQRQEILNILLFYLVVILLTHAFVVSFLNKGSIIKMSRFENLGIETTVAEDIG